MVKNKQKNTKSRKARRPRETIRAKIDRIHILAMRCINSSATKKL